MLGAIGYHVGGINANRSLKNHLVLMPIPVIYFSANAKISTLAEKTGADSFLSKPFGIQFLEEFV